MALVRCERCGRPKGRSHTYVASVKPIGYPETAAICGSAWCEQPGLVWLDKEEKTQYERGQRVFSIPSAAVKIKVA
jgi:hypothetical protein